MYTGEDFWKNYMEKWWEKDLIKKWKENVTIDEIKSNGRTINLEIYDIGNENAPTIIFAHGIAGYARLLLPFTMPLFERGFNLVVPDMQGYGYNDGLKGDFEWNAHKQNLIDAAEYARSRFKGKLVIGGASMGGPLAYAAACEDEKIDALICWCLMDFADREFMLNETSTKKFTYMLIPLFKIMSKLFGKMRLRTYRLISYDTLTDSKEFNQLIKQDPQAGTHITLKGTTSLVLQSKPKKLHELFKIPTLVLQPGADKMTPKYYTQKVFEKLGSKNKKYVEIDNQPHFPSTMAPYYIWADEVSKFIDDL